MRHKKLSRGLALLAIFAVTMLAAASAVAQQERVLHTFIANEKDASVPYASVIFDKAGNLYGTSAEGGTSNLGTVYELKPKAGGGWTDTVLHSFTGGTTDGSGPRGGVVIDATGNLYGTTGYGGANGDGIVYELSPAAGGGWTETVLHSFNYGTDGEQPSASLVIDSLGNLYGTTSYGGTGTACGLGCGTLFELSPQSGGGWNFTILHTFNNNGTDGYHPLYGALVFDSKGNLYGTTEEGGTDNDGIVYELSPQAGGGWTEAILHNFLVNNVDGNYPDGGVIFDSKGNLYGTTREGGNSFPGYGTVYELSQGTGGSWTETILYNFSTSGGSPIYPDASLTFDTHGHLWSTTSGGGSYGWGTAFELKAGAKGAWTEVVGHSFQDNRQDGTAPYAALTLGPSGRLYGTTAGGGATDGAGTVFEIAP